MPHRRRDILILLALLAALSALFLSAGNAIDIGVARLFGNASGFPLGDDVGLELLREINHWIVVGTIAACFGAMLHKLVWPAHRMRLRPRAIAFLLLTLIVGPGLLANTVLKDQWGRPRPNDTVVFGGMAPYVPPWVITDHCDDNCSFVSGEGASAMWTVAPALLAPLPERPFVVAGAVAWGLVMGLVRIAMGGHFLSDTLIGAVLMLIVIGVFRKGLWRLISPERDQALEAAIGRAGDRLRAAARRR